MSRGPDKRVPAEDVLREFVVSPDAAFVPTEIADELGVSDQTARNYLDDLAEKGLLKKKKPSERTVFYWITEDGERYYAKHVD